jgi:hypothetical protein
VLDVEAAQVRLPEPGRPPRAGRRRVFNRLCKRGLEVLV